MALKFPCTNGRDATDDNRLTLDPANQPTWLSEHYSLLGLDVDDLFITQNYFGVNNNGLNVRFDLIGNSDKTNMNGAWRLSFHTHSNNTSAKQGRIEFNFKPNYSSPDGGNSAAVTLYSQLVTKDNVKKVIVERRVNDYAVHIVDHYGSLLKGDYTTHYAPDGSSDSLGILMRLSSYPTIYIGGTGSPVGTASLNQHHRGALSNLFMAESATGWGDPDTVLQSVADCADLPALFGSDLTLYRKLQDLTTVSLTASGAGDINLPDIVAPTSHRIEIASDKTVSNSASYVRLDEASINTVGVAIDNNGTISRSLDLKGDYFGTVASIEGRLIDKKTDAVVIDWITLVTSPTGNTWSGSFTGVGDEVYRVELRPSNAPANVYVGQNEWVVAPLMAIHGQSQCTIAKNGDTNDAGLNVVPSDARVYFYDAVDMPSYEVVTLIRFDELEDYPDGLQEAAYAWYQVHGDKPVIFCDLFVSGQSVGAWLNGTNYPQAEKIRNISKIDTINLLFQWGTSDMTNPDYEEQMQAWLFNNIPAYQGAGNYHLNDLFTISSIAVSPLTRHDAEPGGAGGYSGAYLTNTGKHRHLMIDLFTQWSIDHDFKLIIGSYTGDILMEGNAGPHQVGASDPNYLMGSPRIGTAWGIAAAWLADSVTHLNPYFYEFMFNEDKTAFTMKIMPTHGGVIRNNHTDNIVPDIALTTDDGYSLVKTGFSATFSGDTVTVTKDTGDWSAETNLKVVYAPDAPVSTLDSGSTAQTIINMDRLLVEDYAPVTRGLQVASIGRDYARSIVDFVAQVVGSNRYHFDSMSAVNYDGSARHSGEVHYH